jgi:hypothetical protein
LSRRPAARFAFDFFEPLPIQIEVSDAPLTSEAGLLPALSLTIDLDAVDDPTHGSQQLTLFHAFYEQYQYLPLLITSAATGQVVMVRLRHGTAAASLGADDDLAYLVRRVRGVWPNVQIHMRGDGGFTYPTMFEVCERLEITYTFGLSTNHVLQRASEELLAEAVRLWQETREPQRLFDGFRYRACSWPVARFVVVKAEANAQGTNRRFVVTNRAGASRYLEATYDESVLQAAVRRGRNCRWTGGWDILAADGQDGQVGFKAGSLPKLPFNGRYGRAKVKETSWKTASAIAARGFTSAP